jgi:hypothetical protein
MPALSSSIGELLTLEVLLHELVVGLGDALDQLVAVLLGPSCRSAGISSTV